MSIAPITETHDELMRRLSVERTEMVREIGKRNYIRAAIIAEYIRDQLMMFDQRMKAEQP